jgi:hypothetical protein
MNRCFSVTQFLTDGEFSVEQMFPALQSKHFSLFMSQKDDFLPARLIMHFDTRQFLPKKEVKLACYISL